MARTITDEEIKLSIIINGNPAQKQLLELEKATRSLTEENKALNTERRRLEAQGKKDTEEYKKLTATIKANTTSIDNNKASMKELQNQIGLTGLTMNQLNQKANMLKLTLKNLVPGSADYIKYQAELQTVNNRLGELSGRATASRTSLSSLADGFNKYQALAFSAVAVLTGIVLSVQKIIDINGKLSDSQADVMKTTGMNKNEVDELTKSFGLLETRTSRIDLLKIAEQGGRLGIPKAEIQEFVANMNMAAVALGDSFTGGVDEVAEKLGKIKFLFKETADADVATAYNAIGSAINELGANGSASEANIAEFTKRIGSLTDVLKPTVQETLALGAAFEESGIEAETSSRAYNIFMKQASTESGKFAEVMGISKKAVEEMINTNPLDFMLNFSKGLKGMDATEVAKTLDFLGVNADGANKVVGAMGNNFDRFHQLIDLSNKSFSDGTSLITEYDVKNNNLAATLEKVGKKVNGWFSSQGFNDWLFNMVDGFARLIGATKDVDGSSQKWRNTLVFTAKVIAIVISAMVTSIGWQKLLAMWTARNTEATLLYNIASKARAFADGVAIISSQLLAAAQMLLAGNLRGAAQAFRVMTATMMTTPWGFVLGAIAAIGTAYLMFSENAKEAATAQSMMADNAKAVNGLVKEESATMMSLLSIIKDTTASNEARSAALVKAKEIGGEYTKALTLENATTFEGKKMIDAYIASLERKMTLQVLEAKQADIIKQMNDKKSQSLEEEISYWDQLYSGVKNFGNVSGSTTDLVVTASNRRKMALDELQKKLKYTNAEMKAFLEANPDVIKDIDTGKSNYNVPGGKGDDKKGGSSKKDPNSTQEEINRLLYDDAAKWADLTLKLKRQLEDEKLAATQEGYEKELAIENLRFKRETEDLEKQKVHADEIVKIDAEISKAKESGDIKKYDALLKIKQTWKEKNENIDNLINSISESKLQIHQIKQNTILERQAQKEFKELNEKYEREKLLRQTAYYEQLALLGNNENAKAKLKKNYEEEELKQQKAHLELMVKEYQKVLVDMNGNVDLSFLTKEQKQEFEDNINELINKISKLKSEIAGLKGGGSGTDFNILQGQGTDILGFSPEQWDSVFSNFDTTADKINAVSTVLGGLQNTWGMYSAFMDANGQKELKQLDKSNAAKKKKLKQDLDNGVINKVQYNRALEKLDTDKEKKQAELEYKKAKRDRIASLANIVINTGMGIMKAVAASPLTVGMPWTAIIGAMGAVQAATILATPLPAKGFEQGLYGDYVKREQDGKLFKSSGTSKMQTGLFSKPRILVGEGPGDMPEMVIDKKAFSQISPATKNALISELRGIKGFENGYYNQDKMRIEVPAGNSSNGANSNDQLMIMVLNVLAENTAVMKDIRDNPLIALVDSRDTRSMKNLKEGIEKYNKLLEKTKM